MSEFLAAAASTMKVPETLVKRSAEARAKAAGTSVDDVLQAWAGGDAAPAATLPSAPAPEEAQAPPPSAAASSAAVETPADTAVEPSAVPSVAPAPVVVTVEPEPEPVEAAALRDRARVSARAGMAFGLVAAVFALIFSAQWLLGRATSMPDGGEAVSFGFTVAAGKLVLASALLGAAVGVAAAGFVRLVTGWTAPGMRLVSSHTASLVTGALTGLFVGAVVGGVVAGSGVPDPVDETLTAVPLLASVLWTVFGWVAGGWLIGTLVQVVGLPAGIPDHEIEDSLTVKGRLSAAFSLPVMAAVSILLLVLPAAWVFIQFPEWAPLIAIFIAGGILAFAGLSAARPGMRVSRGEFLTAVAGIGVIVLIVVSVLTAQGVGHDEGSSEEHAGEAAVLLVRL